MRTLALVFSLMFVLVGSGIAEVPHLINYQGKLVDKNSGSPITTQTPIEFHLYDANTGGNDLWGETANITPDTNGVFNHLLGSVVPLPAIEPSGDDLWLGVTVGSDSEMTPRQQIVTVGYAIAAEAAETVKGENLSVSDLGNVSRPNQSYVVVHHPTDISQGPIPSNASTIVNFSRVEFDTQGEFDPDTHKFTATEAGQYLVVTGVLFTEVVANKNYSVIINSSAHGPSHPTEVVGKNSAAEGQSNIGSIASAILDLGAGDQVWVTVDHNAGVDDQVMIYWRRYNTYLHITKLN